MNEIVTIEKLVLIMTAFAGLLGAIAGIIALFVRPKATKPQEKTSNGEFVAKVSDAAGSMVTASADLVKQIKAESAQRISELEKQVTELEEEIRVLKGRIAELEKKNASSDIETSSNN